MEQVQKKSDNRTNIRAPRGAIGALRTTFWLLERLAPGQGSALAEKLWCRVPAVGGSARRDLRPRPGEPIEARVGGRRVVGETWGDGPTVYLSAGWGGWRGQVGALVDPLVDKGFRVVTFDALSHGESDPGAMGPQHSTLGEYADSLAAVAGVAGEPYAIVAHSAGCVAAALAAGDGLPVRQLVFIAPMADPVPYIHDFRRILGFGGRIEAGLIARLERQVGRSLADFNVLSLAEKLPVPLLVVHDRQDKETRFADGVAITEAWSDAELVPTEGLGHRRILSDPAVVARVTGFLAERRG
jgi:pimeloyl-ACP methyl ester carboxylesterase